MTRFIALVQRIGDRHAKPYRTVVYAKDAIELDQIFLNHGLLMLALEI